MTGRVEVVEVPADVSSQTVEGDGRRSLSGRYEESEEEPEEV